mgnify:CR=1 FL=1
MKNIGIIGNGFVGSAILHGFILHANDVLVHDKNKNISNNTLEQTVKNSEIIFVNNILLLCRNLGIESGSK